MFFGLFRVLFTKWLDDEKMKVETKRNNNKPLQYQLN